ncbi:hypothetical protein C0J52_09120 [Blattella germanica]|nr:hypothetical protein C0J52_09120 [Blattella germanica]
MKLTSVLFAQHIGKTFERHWRVQSRRVPLPTKAEEILKANGITVYEPGEILKEKQEFPESILTSHVFEATQLKLPKLKDPARPAWVFPRPYGITDKRRNELLSLKLVHLCEMACGRSVGRSLLQNERVCFPFEKDGDLIQLDLTVNFLLNLSKPLPSYASVEEVESTKDIPLPDLYPIKHTVTLTKENIYEIQNIFSFPKRCPFPHVHTAIIHYEDTEVKNLYEEPVTEKQILGRTLLKAFAVAGANARQRFGDDVKDLPEPITLQCVHTDGRLFHFAVFQLNTLDLDGTEGVRNILWTLPRMPLFGECQYEDGKPSLKDYNKEVFQHLLAFYANGLKM